MAISRIKTFSILLLATGFATSLTTCGINQKLVTRPLNIKPFISQKAKLEKMGEALWKNPSLSVSGTTSCNTCHNVAAIKGGAPLNLVKLGTSFKKSYPHTVPMVEDMTGLKNITAEQMVQFCMLAPMEQSKPLPWDSKNLAALTAYTLKLNKIVQNRK